MIALIEAVHKKGVVHGDLQPDHFLMGLGQDGNSVNLVDFGCARCDREPVTSAKEDLKVPCEDYCASINSHNGEDLSRKDDLESLVYVLLNLYCGPLPWKGLRKHRVVGMKKSVPREIISRSLPEQFADFLKYAQTRAADDTPDYSFLREMFKTLYYEQGFSLDPIFDWNKKK